jgi:hypothetical protein
MVMLCITGNIKPASYTSKEHEIKYPFFMAPDFSKVNICHKLSYKSWDIADIFI